MLSSCTLVSCTPSPEGLFTYFTACSKGIGHKGKARGCSTPKILPPKILHSPGEPGSLLGARGQPWPQQRKVFLYLRDKTDTGHTNQITTDRG